MRVWLYTNAIALVATWLEIMWTTPSGPSSYDLSQSPLGDLPLYSIPVIVLASVSLWVFRRRPNALMAAILAIVTGGLLVEYWLSINYDEFASRVAAWSTWTDEEIWQEVYSRSLAPITVCALTVTAGLYGILRFSIRLGVTRPA